MKNSQKEEKTIIIADDDEDLAFIISSQLTRHGFKVQVCMSGKNLVDSVIKYKPALLLLDISMQEVDGGELCQKIKSDSRFNQLKILLLSGNHDIAAYAENCGADGYIEKPLSFRNLKEVINGYI